MTSDDEKSKMTTSAGNEEEGGGMARVRGYAVLFPVFRRLDQLADHYHRLRWYIPENSGFDAYLFYDPSLEVSPRSIRQVIPEYTSDDLGGDSNLHLIPWSWSSFLSVAIGSVAIMLWQARLASFLDKVSVLIKKRFVVVDPSVRTACRRHTTFLFDHMGVAERRVLRRQSESRLALAGCTLGGLKKAYVFGNGPSLSQATEFDYGDGIRIVCNSIVRNQDLLNHIKPHFIAAADFVFHYGPSKYAAAFRRDLVSALETTGAYFLTAEQLAPLMFHHYPEIQQRVIAVPVSRRYGFRANARGVNVQLLDAFQVCSLESVLNLLMLPVASTLADEVYFIGCDGRKPDDKGFWSHHRDSQYTGLMQTVKDCHPGFFALDYVDYYERYCEHIAAVIAAGESLGKTYASLVPSYVPALAKRPYRPNS